MIARDRGKGVRARLDWLALVGAAVMLLASPALARAGSYTVGACTAAVGEVNHSWEAFDNAPAYLEANERCGEAPITGVSGGLANLAVGDVLESGNAPESARAGWSVASPAQTTVVAVEGSDDLFKDTNNDWNVFVKDAGGSILDGQTCAVELRHGSYCETAGRFQALGLNTSAISIGVECTENSFHNCPDGATIHDVRAELDEATVTINDPVAPSGVTGSVPAGPQHGVVVIKASASDAAAGIASVSVINGSGAVVGGPVVPPPGCDYSYVTPCPTAVTELPVEVQTTELPNGEDPVRVRATNAASDTAESTPYLLTVENPIPVTERGGSSGGGGPTEEHAGAGGTGATTTTNPLVDETLPGLGSAGTSHAGTTPAGPGSGAHGKRRAVILHLGKPALEVGRAARSHAHAYLLVSGTISPGATGVITATATSGGGAYAWTVHARAGIHKRRFQLRFTLPARASVSALARAVLMLHLSYAGNSSFRPAHIALRSRL
jgi:hypothetical protein